MAQFLPSGYNLSSADGVIAVQCCGQLVFTPGAGYKSKAAEQRRRKMLEPLPFLETRVSIESILRESGYKDVQLLCF